jgi:hypothetical protein
MATKSRTYKPTDWQLWVYTPVAGKFRLDFSALDGADVLGGATDLGSVQVLPLRIGTIQLDSGQRPDQGVFSSIIPNTMAISAQLLTWSATTVKELYNGKQVFLTLKNEATNSHPIFGKNTIYFIGQIDSLDIAVDPVNKITNLTFTAVDVMATLLNQPMTMLKSNATSKDFQLVNAIGALSVAGFISPYIQFDLSGDLTSTYELNVTESKSLGSWLDDFITSEVALVTPYTYQWYTGTWVLKSTLKIRTIQQTPTTGELIPESLISAITIGQDGANSPNAFNLANSTAIYTYGNVSGSSQGNPVVYNNTIDVATAGLKTVADKITTFTQAIQPTEITVRTAQTNQTIVFDNTRPLSGFFDYTYPKYFWINGQNVKTTPTYTGATYYHQIVGTSHTITPDDWQTTYQLWKGLDAPVLPTNFVNNGSATSSTDLTNWYGVARTTSTYLSSPASWVATYDAGNDWYQAEFYKASALTISTYYSLSFWAKSIVPGTVINASILAGSNSSNINITPSTSTWTYYKIENIQCIGSAQLDVVWNAPSNAYYIDDVWVVSGPTAY